MVWHTTIAAQRQTPRGEVAMTCAGHPGFRAGSKDNHELGRWRG